MNMKKMRCILDNRVKFKYVAKNKSKIFKFKITLKNRAGLFRPIVSISDFPKRPKYLLESLDKSWHVFSL